MLHCFPKILMSPRPSSFLGDGFFMEKEVICLYPYMKEDRKEK